MFKVGDYVRYKTGEWVGIIVDNDSKGTVQTYAPLVIIAYGLAVKTPGWDTPGEHWLRIDYSQLHPEELKGIDAAFDFFKANRAPTNTKLLNWPE